MFVPIILTDEQIKQKMLKAPVYNELDKKEIVDKSIPKNSENVRQMKFKLMRTEFEFFKLFDN